MIQISDLLFDRMEVTAHAGSEIVAKAKAESRPLTRMEAWQLRIMDIEQEQRRREWAETLQSEGRRVSLLDFPDRTPKTGITVRNNGPGRPTVWLYGDIGREYGGLTAEGFREALVEIPDSDEFDLHVHSDGGNYHEAVAMHAMIRARSALVFGFIDGRACSAATIPLMACATITASNGAWMMIHQAAGSLRDGKADDFADMAEQLYATNEQLANYYSRRWSGTREQLLNAIKRETWFSAQDAVTVGLADSISDRPAIAASAVSRRHQFKNVPAPVSIAARDEDCPNLLRAALCLHRMCLVR